MDKELLFKPRLPEADVEIPGVGTVRVRGLSRAEAMLVRNIDDRAEGEQMILSLAVVDPQLSTDDAARWQQASAAMEIEAVTDKVTELSGMLNKEAYKSLPDGSDA